VLICWWLCWCVMCWWLCWWGVDVLIIVLMTLGWCVDV
jgi:hypothetical protein